MTRPSCIVCNLPGNEIMPGQQSSINTNNADEKEASTHQDEIISCQKCNRYFHLSCIILSEPDDSALKEGTISNNEYTTAINAIKDNVESWICGSCTKRMKQNHVRDIMKLSNIPNGNLEKNEFMARLSVFDSFFFLIEGDEEEGKEEGKSSGMKRSLPPSFLTDACPPENKKKSVLKVIDVISSGNLKDEVPEELSMRASSTPGCIEEKRELSERLSVFDDFMFLLDESASKR